MQSFTLEELAASKLIALVRRSAARDLFDVAMLADIGELDMETFKTLVVVRGASYPPPGPDAYGVAAAGTVRPQRWRSEVMALARRPISVDHAKPRSWQANCLLKSRNLAIITRTFCGDSMTGRFERMC